jgi:hypothetical protein
MAIKDRLFKAEWNEEAYGKKEPEEISLIEFIEDQEDWGFENEEIIELINLDLNEVSKSYAPWGWSTKITRIT